MLDIQQRNKFTYAFHNRQMQLHELMPAKRRDFFAGHDDILRYEKISYRYCRRQDGIGQVRVTGGEPLVRPALSLLLPH